MDTVFPLKYYWRWVTLFTINVFLFAPLRAKQTTISSDCYQYFNTSPSSFSSPGFPGGYDDNLECYYRAETSSKNVVKLEFDFFDMEPANTCSYDYVMVYDGSSENAQKLSKLCGDQIPSPVYSTGKDMLVRLKTDSFDSRKGFSAIFSFLEKSSAPTKGCLENFNTSSSTFSSPAYPSPYAPNLECNYLAETTPENIIELIFISMSICYEDDCSFDSVEVYDGTSTEDVLLATFCGDIAPSPVYNTGNKMLVKFKTSQYGRFRCKGFEGLFTFQNAATVPFGVPCDVPPYTYVDNLEEQQVADGRTAFLQCEDSYASSDGKIIQRQCVNGLFSPVMNCYKIDCNNMFTSTGSNFTSPGYPYNYPPNLECTYKAKALPGFLVKLTFTSISIYWDGKDCCDYAITVYDGLTDEDMLLATFCGAVTPSPVYSTKNEMLVAFTAPSFYGYTYTGFEGFFTFLNTSTVDFLVPCYLPDHAFVEEFVGQQVLDGQTVILRCEESYTPSTAEIRLYQCVNGSFVPHFECIFYDCTNTYTTSGSTFISPGYPNNYPPNLDCAYQAVAPPGYVVELVFSHLSIFQDYRCAYHPISVYDGNSTDYLHLATFCGQFIPYPVYSTGNEMLVTFSVYDYHGYMYSGFEAVFNFLDSSLIPLSVTCDVPNHAYTEHYGRQPMLNGQNDRLLCEEGFIPSNGIVQFHQCENGTIVPPFGCNAYDCKNIFESSSSTFSSPGYPNNYAPGLDCSYQAETVKGYVVKLTFKTFDLHYDYQCDSDTFSVYDVNDTKRNRISKICGDAVPYPMYSSGNKMLVTFTSFPYGEHRDKGFEAVFTFVPVSSLPPADSCFVPENVDIVDHNKEPIPHTYTAFLQCRKGYLPPGPHIYQCLNGTFYPKLEQCYTTGCTENIYTSPSFFTPPGYPLYYAFLNCVWTAYSPSDNVIMVTFTSFQMHQVYLSWNDLCEEDSTSVYDGNTTEIDPIAVFCADYRPEPIYSKGATMAVGFVSNYYPAAFEHGFEAYITFVNVSSVPAAASCFPPLNGSFVENSRNQVPHGHTTKLGCDAGFLPGGTSIHQCVNGTFHPLISCNSTGCLEYFTSSPALFSSVGSPTYALYSDCYYRAEAPQGSAIKLTFRVLAVTGGRECWSDVISVFDDRSVSEPIGTFCGYEIPCTLYSSENFMLVTFRSDHSTSETETGFEATFTFLEKSSVPQKEDCYPPHLAHFVSYQSETLPHGHTAKIKCDDGFLPAETFTLQCCDGMFKPALQCQDGLPSTLATKRATTNAAPTGKDLTALTKTSQVMSTFNILPATQSITICKFDRLFFRGVELTFSATLSGASTDSIEVCGPYSSKPITPLASRNCINQSWDEPHLIDCYISGDFIDAIERISEVNVTKENVHDVASETALLSSQTEDLSADQVDDIADSLQSIAETGSQSQDVTNSVVGIVSNIMDLEKVILEEAGYTNTFHMSLEQQISNVQQNSDNFTAVEKNVAVKAVKIDPDIADAITFTNIVPADWYENQTLEIPLSEKNLLLFNNAEEVVMGNSITSIYLPSKVQQRFMEANQDMAEIPYSFFIYKDSRLFITDRSTKNIEGNMTFHEEIVSQVIAVTVEAQNNTLNNLPPEDAVISRFLPINFQGRPDTVISRKCVFWKISQEDSIAGRWSEDGCETMFNPRIQTQIVCRCTHLTSFAVLFRLGSTNLKPFLSLSLITKIGASLSVAGLTASVFTQLLIKSLRKKQETKVHINLFLSLIGFYVSFLVGDLAKGNVKNCKNVATAAHYFCLSTIAWTWIEAMNMYLQYIKVPRTGWKYFVPASCFICYGLSLVPTLVVYYVDTTELVDYCFLHPGNSLYYGLILEIALMVAFNIVIFSLLVRHIVCGPRFDNAISKKKNLITRMHQFLLFWVFLGLSWTLGFLVAIPGRPSIVSEILFCIFTSLQGFSLFIFICVKNQEVHQQIMKLKSSIKTSSSTLEQKEMDQSALLSYPVSETDTRLKRMTILSRRTRTDGDTLASNKIGYTALASNTHSETNQKMETATTLSRYTQLGDDTVEMKEMDRSTLLSDVSGETDPKVKRATTFSSCTEPDSLEMKRTDHSALSSDACIEAASKLQMVTTLSGIKTISDELEMK